MRHPLRGDHVNEHALDIWHEATRALAERNGAVELAAAADDDADAEVFRTRLLAVGAEGQLLVERPGVAGVSAAMHAGSTVRLTLLHDGRRWQGDCRVLGVAHLRLAGVTAPALRLAPPRSVRSGQRRRFFRVALTALDLEGLRLCVESDGGAEPIEAYVVNLSGGGIGVRAPNPAGLQRGELYRCRFRLPDALCEFDLAARLVHIEPLPDRAAYLGLEFVFDDPAAERRVRDELVRFVSELERRQLRRLRGAG